MKKYLILIAVILFLSSCAGFFSSDKDKNSDNEGNAINTLRLADGSGYLSTDTANEVTPFLFRDTNSNEAYLFYASDEEAGFLNIYYAKMYSDGTFDPPVKMSDLINHSGDDDFSPVVFLFNDTNYISYICIFGESTNVVTYALDSSFTPLSALPMRIADAKHIGLFNTDFGPNLYVANGSTNIQIGDIFTEFDAWLNGFWDAGIYPSAPTYSISGFFDSYGGGSGIGNYFICDSFTNGKRQISVYVYINTEVPVTTNITTFYFIPQYESSYNDINPFVDKDGGFKVYFSSDRNGTYDLYRYNITTFDNLVDEYPLLEYVSNNLL